MKTISFLPENFEEIKGHLKRGNLVVFATESSYGISGDITIPRTIKRAEQIKQREPQKQAFLCLVAQFSEMEKWGDTTFLTPKLKKETEEIPTTFILPKSKIFPKFYFPSFQKIGIRKTLYKPLEGFLHFYKTPIFSTSANLLKGYGPRSLRYISRYCAVVSRYLLARVSSGVRRKAITSTVPALNTYSLNCAAIRKTSSINSGDSQRLMLFPSFIS